ncbi:unnamed protein product [Lampetra planeri]
MSYPRTRKNDHAVAREEAQKREGGRLLAKQEPRGSVTDDQSPAPRAAPVGRAARGKRRFSSRTTDQLEAKITLEEHAVPGRRGADTGHQPEGGRREARGKGGDPRRSSASLG